ncbi:MAG: glutathione S-transferase family protein [Minwuia sp.]|uniref:glutathione S-transferase family protein n=1 Tax=Minwuia sp. TaxID=2493630 RepID=UPI003A870157
MRLFQYPGAFGLPCPSPFCTKAEILLKMAGIDFEDVRVNDPRKGPKGKLPALEIDGRLIGDSEIIRYEIEKRTGFDFEPGLDDRQKAVSHAMARMIEERLYWAIVHTRWVDDASFAGIRESFFSSMPPVVRNIVPIVARRQVKGYLHGHGLGRHTPEEIAAFGAKDISALADWLGTNSWMMGETPSYLDATAWAHLANIVVPKHAASPLDAAVRTHANLMDYVERGRLMWFPDSAAA